MDINKHHIEGVTSQGGYGVLLLVVSRTLSGGVESHDRGVV